MQFALLIYADEALQPPTDGEREMAEPYQAFNRRHEPALRGGEALQPTSTATTVRVRDGERVLHDGPFAESREQLGGFYLVEADDLDDALAVAAEVPAAALGAVEVRPVMTFAGVA
jgi:hypothetical protein